jgi:tryptophanyl-tRNA synthetase
MSKIILSGLRPTDTLHLGNYFGALLPLVKLQKEADDFYIMIADIHALTTLDETKNLNKNSLRLAMLFIAAGIDPSKSTIFVQSQVPEHTELSTILGMITPVSMLELNPVYKEMKTEHPKHNTLGLFSYPVLQSADILLYQTTGVPVGKDQEAHIELSREIARRFNSRFGNTFAIPKTILKEGSKIYSLQDPSKKMSKSHGEKNFVSLLDSPEAIRKKIKSAVTDSGDEIKYDEKNKPAVSNLLTIYSLLSNRPVKDIEKEYKGKGYGSFKSDLAEVVIKGLEPIQAKYKELENNPDYVKQVLAEGVKKARQTASATLQKVHEKIGFLK